MKDTDIIKNYLSKIHREIFQNPNSEKFISQLRNDIYDFCEFNPECSFEEIEREFGTTEEVVHDFLEAYDKISLKEVKKSKYIGTAIIVVLILVISIAIYSIYKSIKAEQEEAGSYATQVLVVEPPDNSTED